MFFAVNHTMHSLHTVKHGSQLASKLEQSQVKNERRTFFIKGTRYSAFSSASGAREFLVVLQLFGAQS